MQESYRNHSLHTSFLFYFTLSLLPFGLVNCPTFFQVVVYLANNTFDRFCDYSGIVFKIIKITTTTTVNFLHNMVNCLLISILLKLH